MLVHSLQVALEMARASICIECTATIYRLAWFTQSRSGLYFGHLGSDKDYHHSYHQDGTRHFKIDAETHHESSDTPVASHKGFRQLSNSNVALSPEWLNNRTVYVPGRRSETVIIVPESAAAGKDSLLIDWYLTNCADEAALRTTVHTFKRKGSEITLVQFSTIPLSYFPNHAVCFALWVGNTRNLHTTTTT